MNRSLCFSLLVASALAASLSVGACSGAGPAADAVPVGAPEASTVPPPAPEAGVVDTGADNGIPETKVSETTVDFGASDCGGSPPPDKVVTLSNAGGGTVTWSAQLDATPYFSLVGATSGSFHVGGSATINIHAKAIPATATAAAQFKGTLLLTTNDPKKPATFIPLQITAQGATLTLTPYTAAFGQSPLNFAAPDILLTVTNTGNKTVDVGFAQPLNGDFKLTWTGSPAPNTLAPNASVPALAAHFTPTTLTNAVTSAPISVTGAVCGTTVASIPMTGQGTAGVAGVSPGVLDFGLVDCGARATDQLVTIKNLGNAAFTWTATLGKGAASPYSLIQSSGTASANSSFQLAVITSNIPQTSAITPNLYGDTLTVTTTSPSDVPHVIQLTQTARGAIIGTSVPSLDFGPQPVQIASASKPVTLTNTGNISATVTATSGNAAYVITPSGATALASAGGSVNIGGVFTPSVFGASNSDITLSTPAVLCSPLPATIALTGSGRGVATQVAPGSDHTCALIQGGRVACWGSNTVGQLGNGVVSPVLQPTPSLVTGLVGAKAVVSGGGCCGSQGFSCAITATDGLVCWGYGNGGALGNGGTTNRSAPTAVAGISSVKQVSAGSFNACAVTTTGAAYCWGQGSYGALGNGTGNSSNSPVQVVGVGGVGTLTGATSIAAGGYFGCAVAGATPTVYCWGLNYYGQVGIGTSDACCSVSHNSPAAVTLLNGVTPSAVIAGSDFSGHACALMSNNTAQCWGYNGNGQVGWGQFGCSAPASCSTTSNAVNAPAVVSNLTNAIAMTATNNNTCAQQSGGFASCWGSGGNGQNGTSSNNSSAVPVSVTNLANVVQVGANGDSVCAVVTGGGVQCWGDNVYGQLGKGDSGSGTNANVPGSVLNF